MAGLYLHIPFCKQACSYCNFHFSTSLIRKGELVAALRKEIRLQKKYLADSCLKSVYFGGGTPSLLSAAEIDSLMAEIHANFIVTADAEITIEANPDDLTATYLANLKTSAVNRLSIGIQSFREEDLRYMRRAHDAKQAVTCLQEAQAAGFEQLSLDLIYGTPTMSEAGWQQNLETAFSFRPAHLSCYALTVEPKTILAKQIAKGLSIEPKDQAAARHFQMLSEYTRDAGYEHYEISNLCRDGQYARHNSAYWQSQPYLGIGPSAHSYNGVSRQWNVANNAEYLKALGQEQIPFTLETLTGRDQWNEYLMTGLRTKWGVSDERLQILAAEHPNWHIVFQAQAEHYRQEGVLEQLGDVWRLKTEAWFLADGIIASLFAEA